MEDNSTNLNARDTRRELISSMKQFTWQDYITIVLLDSGNVTSASIQRLKDGAVWAASKDFLLTKDEVKTITDGFDDDIKLRQNGIWLQGHQYTLTRIAGRWMVVGREEKTGTGCIIYRCATCLITAIYQENNHPGQCYAIITQLGDFLIEQGF